MSDFSDMEDDDALIINFNNAAEYLSKNHDKFDPTGLLDLYGLYKQSTVGDCNTQRPGIFSISARAKWDAWNKCKTLLKETAMEQYIEKLTELSPNWDENFNKGISAGRSWVAVSSHAVEEDEKIDDDEKTLIDFVKEGNIDQLEQLVKTLEICSVNDLDESGLALIHWATDRGHVRILEFLIKQCGADYNQQDIDGQTALHFASSCGHHDCVKLLLEFSADITIKDTEGQTCLDVAFDETVLKLFN